MPMLQIEECPDDLYEQLCNCAVDQGISASEQLIDILEEYLTEYFRMQEKHGEAFRAANLIYV